MLLWRALMFTSSFSFAGANMRKVSEGGALVSKPIVYPKHGQALTLDAWSRCSDKA